MIDLLLFLLGAAFFGMVGLVVVAYTLRFAIELLMPVLLAAVELAIWLKKFISRTLQRRGGGGSPCF